MGYVVNWSTRIRLDEILEYIGIRLDGLLE